MGTELACQTFAFLRQNGLRATMSCGFLRAVARRHPEYADVLLLDEDM